MKAGRACTSESASKEGEREGTALPLYFPNDLAYMKLLIQSRTSGMSIRWE